MNEVIIKTNDEFKKFHSSTVKTKLMSLIRVLLSLKRVAWTYKYKEKKKRSLKCAKYEWRILYNTNLHYIMLWLWIKTKGKRKAYFFLSFMKQWQSSKKIHSKGIMRSNTWEVVKKKNDVTAPLPPSNTCPRQYQ